MSTLKGEILHNLIHGTTCMYICICAYTMIKLPCPTTFVLAYAVIQAKDLQALALTLTPNLRLTPNPKPDPKPYA